MSETINILIVGVGGQGIILASKVLANTALAAGLDVKQSEVHGMAQRGGSVSSHVRFGEKVDSPTIERGRADVLLSFELMESLRWVDALKPDGVVIVNTQQIDPMPVASGKAEYPDDVLTKLESHCAALYPVDGRDLAGTAGHIKSVNVVLLGVLSTLLQFNESAWISAIQNQVPKKTIEINNKAFQLGREQRK
ncbi:MAG: indolepyruvate oxidoreductase subunit beta [candidate division KSB1 bacterium]|nr:indolepyruvate oxidoreductase subunit beta [candidate division KSB1 bacterium]